MSDLVLLQTGDTAQHVGPHSLSGPSGCRHQSSYGCGRARYVGVSTPVGATRNWTESGVYLAEHVLGEPLKDFAIDAVARKQRLNASRSCIGIVLTKRSVHLAFNYQGRVRWPAVTARATAVSTSAQIWFGISPT